MTAEERALGYWKERRKYTDPIVLHIIVQQAARSYAPQISASEAMGVPPPIFGAPSQGTGGWEQFGEPVRIKNKTRLG